MPKIGFSLLEEYARKKQGSVNPLGIIARMVSKVCFFYHDGQHGPTASRYGRNLPPREMTRRPGDKH